MKNCGLETNSLVQLKEYFDAFSSKDAEKLKDIYADDVSLRDWLNSVSGKEAVLESNNRFFAAVTDLEINVKRIYYDANSTAACEIDINLNHKDGTRDELLVVDVIEFNEDNKIKSIRAYIGNV